MACAHLIVVEKAADFRWAGSGSLVVTAEEFISEHAVDKSGASTASRRPRKVINLCRNYDYLSLGYYCSLLAEARGDRITPTVDTPAAVLRAAVDAAKLIGDGFYGVDLKENAAGVFVIEINDNPNLDVGCEDNVLGDDVYRRLLGHLLAKFEVRSEANSSPSIVVASASAIDADDRAPARCIAIPTAWRRASH